MEEGQTEKGQFNQGQPQIENVSSRHTSIVYSAKVICLKNTHFFNFTLLLENEFINWKIAPSCFIAQVLNLL